MSDRLGFIVHLAVTEVGLLAGYQPSQLQAAEQGSMGPRSEKHFFPKKKKGKSPLQQSQQVRPQPHSVQCRSSLAEQREPCPWPSPAPARGPPSSPPPSRLPLRTRGSSRCGPVSAARTATSPRRRPRAGNGSGCAWPGWSPPASPSASARRTSRYAGRAQVLDKTMVEIWD